MYIYIIDTKKTDFFINELKSGRFESTWIDFVNEKSTYSKSNLNLRQSKKTNENKFEHGTCEHGTR